MRNSVPTLAILATLLAFNNGAAQQALYIEAERCQFLGDWFVEARPEAHGGKNLRSDNSGAGHDAMIVVSLPTAATYHVWARTRDFDTYTGQRRFQLGIDGVLFSEVLGDHGENGFRWELAGSRNLSAQDHVISLKDISSFYPRCDAVFLTPNTTDPNNLSETQLNAFRASLPAVAFRNLDSPEDFALRFDSITDTTNGLQALLNGFALAYATNEGGILRFTATTNQSFSTTAFKAPGTGSNTNNLFANCTISVDVRFGAPQQSLGIYSRMPATQSDGHLALVTCDAAGAGTSDTTRIYGPGSDPRTASLSSALLLADSNNLLSAGMWYTLRLKIENTGTGGATFTIQILDRFTGVLRVAKTATGATTLTTAGEVGLRFFSGTGGAGESIDVDNVRITENAPGLIAGGTRIAVATLQGSGCRVTFFSQPDIDGAVQISRETAVLSGGTWVTLPTDDESLFLQYRESVSTFTAGQYVTAWTQPVEFDVGGFTYRTLGSTEDPFLAANMQKLIGRSCEQVDLQTVRVSCRSIHGQTATATWRLGPGGSDVKLTVSGNANRAGYYAFGFKALGPSPAGQTTAHLLPPFYLFQRLPASPKLLTSSVTPQPLALVQRIFPGMSEPVTFGVVADPERLSFQWPSTRSPSYGFSLLNTDGTVQPALFSPVLGLKGSQLEPGAALTASWHVMAKTGDWKTGLEYASAWELGVRDYRQPYRSSLTHSLLNMIDLIQDDSASGWGEELKGPIQIESQSTVTHPSPLTYISVALLNHNESLYERRSLPAIEYTLSRPRPHFATEASTNTPSGYVTTNTTKITIPGTFYGTAYWQGVHDLLGRRNPWLAELALTNGSIRYDVASSFVPRWLEKLGQYRLSPSAALLQDLQTDCTNWLTTEFVTAKTNPAAITAFYHHGYYPFWWGLLDLYELTTNATYLAYAEEGAFHTLAGIFSHPMPPSGNVTANAGGNYMSNATIWWKGPVRYRLGWPRSPGDTPERSVPAWLVSPVGYTLEQPSTYYTLDVPDSPFNLQMMAAWAPQLLRLYRHTARPIYEVYARNAIIGRFSNEPGYYVRGFTDMFHDPLYPYNGPDVSSIYYHHIQARLAFVIDYLFAQAELMSGGRVAFPWAKQHNYVWFTDRIFGAGTGAVYGENELWPWFNRASVQVSGEQVDYLLARGKDSLWVILMNQTNAPVTVNVTNHTEALQIITSEPVKVFEAGQGLPDRPYATPLTVKVPGRTLVALRFSTQSRDVFPRQVPLTATPVVQTLPGAWGKMHAFRIRSPFGSDSLFVVLTGRPGGAASAKLLVDGAPALTKVAYPYEFSIYPWPMDRQMHFRLELTEGTSTVSVEATLPGTEALPPTAYEEWRTANNLPPDAPDYGDSDKDGWRNLLEYAFRLNPQATDAPPAPVVSADAGNLSFSYIKWRSDVSYFVETSTDLQTWTLQGVTETNFGANTTASVPVSANPTFLRLGVSYP